MMTSRPIHGHCFDIEMSVSYISHYLVVRVGCPLYLILVLLVYLRDRELERHSRRFATSLVWIEYHPKSTIEAQPLHFKRSSSSVVEL